MSLTWKLRIVTLSATLGAFCCAPLAAQSYTFEAIRDCSATPFPVAMNSFGVVVGTAGNCGMIYFDGKCQIYPSVFFYGVTDTGWPIASITNGWYLFGPGGESVSLPNYPGAQSTQYCCMDTATGTLAGNYYPGPPGTISGFFYHKGQFTSLPWSGTDGSYYRIAAMNNTGIAVGMTNSAHGFVYAKGEITPLNYPGADQTYFYGINDCGVVVGAYNLAGVPGIFVYNIETGRWTDLHFPYPYNNTIPVGITNTGVIALEYSVVFGGMVLATPTGS
jgi:hypothetical protein